MATVTVQLPNINLTALFSFKDPFAQNVNNILGLNSINIELKVISIASMHELISIDHIDPYVKYYLPLDISEADFKSDLNNNVALISLLYNNTNVVKVPLSYISSYTNIGQNPYINKLMVLDLGELPVNLNLDLYFIDIQNFIETRLGVRPNIKEVNIGEPNLVDSNIYNSRESIRNNLISIHDTHETSLSKLSILYNELLARFNTYRITHP